MPHRHLKAWRERSGLTQEQAAEALGIQQPAYGKWERGEVSPQMTQVAQLALLYRVHPADLFIAPPAKGIAPLWPRMRAVLEALPAAEAMQLVGLGETMARLAGAPQAASSTELTAIVVMDDERDLVMAARRATDENRASLMRFAHSVGRLRHAAEPQAPGPRAPAIGLSLIPARRRGTLHEPVSRSVAPQEGKP